MYRYHIFSRYRYQQLEPIFVLVMYRYHIFSRYRYQQLEPIPPILFHLLSTINKSFCKQHLRMYLVNLAFYCIFEFFSRYLFIIIHYNIIANLQKKVEQIKQYFFIAEYYTNGSNTIIQRKSAYLTNTKKSKN